MRECGKMDCHDAALLAMTAKNMTKFDRLHVLKPESDFVQLSLCVPESFPLHCTFTRMAVFRVHISGALR